MDIYLRLRLHVRMCTKEQVKGAPPALFGRSKRRRMRTCTCAHATDRPSDLISLHIHVRMCRSQNLVSQHAFCSSKIVRFPKYKNVFFSCKIQTKWKHFDLKCECQESGTYIIIPQPFCGITLPIVQNVCVLRKIVVIH